MIIFLIEKIKSILTSRLFWITIVYSILVYILLQRMFELQIITGNNNITEENYHCHPK